MGSENPCTSYTGLDGGPVEEPPGQSLCRRATWTPDRSLSTGTLKGTAPLGGCSGLRAWEMLAMKGRDCRITGVEGFGLRLYRRP